MAHPLGRLHRNLHSAKSPAPAAGPAALGRGAERAGATRPELRRVGYFGSYARGDWGPGSDLDVMIVASAAGDPRARPPLAWARPGLPGPADVLVYPAAELERLDPASRFARTLREETV